MKFVHGFSSYLTSFCVFNITPCQKMTEFFSFMFEVFSFC